MVGHARSETTMSTKTRAGQGQDGWSERSQEPVVGEHKGASGKGEDIGKVL